LLAAWAAEGLALRDARNWLPGLTAWSRLLNGLRRFRDVTGAERSWQNGLAKVIRAGRGGSSLQLALNHEVLGYTTDYPKGSFDCCR
jgi:hypothetical protein